VLTVSVGVSTAFPGEEGGSERLLAAADKALYLAKEQGRNRVCSA
jgi:PleD family two-component response regulator